jgi:hypothetical protein
MWREMSAPVFCAEHFVRVLLLGKFCDESARVLPVEVEEGESGEGDEADEAVQVERRLCSPGGDEDAAKDGAEPATQTVVQTLQHRLRLVTHLGGRVVRQVRTTRCPHRCVRYS